MVARFTRLKDLDLSQSASRSVYPGVTDSDLSVIATDFTAWRLLKLQNRKGLIWFFMFFAFASNWCSVTYWKWYDCYELTNQTCRKVMVLFCRDVLTYKLQLNLYNPFCLCENFFFVFLYHIVYFLMVVIARTPNP